MSTLEIDDIFSFKKPSSSSSIATSSKPKSKSKQDTLKRKSSSSKDNISISVKKLKSDQKLKKKNQVEIVKDPSSTQSKPSTSSSKKGGGGGGGTLFDSEKQIELDQFFNSRGTNGLLSGAITDDGLPIYSEQELGIGQGGDTPLCPFDCDCCF